MGEKLETRDIPYLRQYVRALQIDEFVGDEWLRLTLELFAENAAERPLSDRTNRFELFQAFYDVWRREHERTRDTESALFTEAHLRSALSNFPPAHRQILLLVDIMGFSIAEAASLLGLDDVDARRQLERGRALKEKLRDGAILIVEDEALIVNDLTGILRDLHLTNIAAAKNGPEARAACARRAPDLILADQKLADGDLGLEVVRDLREEVDAPVVFVTAFPEDVLTGAEGEPTFVISKPYSPAAIGAAVVHCLAPRDA